MTWIRDAIEIITAHRRAFVLLNVAFYGSIAMTMAVTAVFFPEHHLRAVQNVDTQLAQGLGLMVANAYVHKQVFLAATLTFCINLGVTFALTSLPSLIVPFFGIAFVMYRAILWGIIFAPVGPNPAILSPHLVTLLVEGFGYVLMAFAVYIQGRIWLQPARVGLPSRRLAFREGVIQSAKLYSLVVVTLAVCAVYEAIEVIYFA